MRKHLGVTLINLPMSNHVRAAIYEYENKFYVLATKYEAFVTKTINGKKYSEVQLIEGCWFA